MAWCHCDICTFFLLLSFSLIDGLRLRGKSDGDDWDLCADEGQLLPQTGRVRFGWGRSWVFSTLPVGAACSVNSFGEDPKPNIRKNCYCAAKAAGGTASNDAKEDFGTVWKRCSAAEGDTCQCTNQMRFGTGSRWLVANVSQNVSGMTCSASSFAGLDPSVGKPKECWCDIPAPHRRRTGLAIVMLSRHPSNFDVWLEYHLGHMEVDHVFVEIEDTPDFNEILKKLKNNWVQRVTVWKSMPAPGSDSRPVDDYESLQKRQLIAMMRAKESSLKMGINWLIHMDDDELLHSPSHRPAGEILASTPAEFEEAYIPNVEAVYTSSSTNNCFTETSTININPFKFNSYANGKAAVRVTDERAYPAGPHQWRDSSGYALPAIHFDRQPFGAPLMIVHFESCPFGRWEDKFWELGNTSPEKIKKIPFKFYRQSIEMMQHCRETGNSRAEGCSDSAFRDFWSKWKTAQNPSLSSEDLMPLDIPWSQILATA